MTGLTEITFTELLQNYSIPLLTIGKNSSKYCIQYGANYKVVSLFRDHSENEGDNCLPNCYN